MGKKGHVTILPDLFSGSGRDQTQGLHHLAHALDTAVEIHRPQDSIDRRSHSDSRDMTTLRWITTNKPVESVKSTNSVEIGIGANLLHNIASSS